MRHKVLLVLALVGILLAACGTSSTNEVIEQTIVHDEVSTAIEVSEVVEQSIITATEIVHLQPTTQTVARVDVVSVGVKSNNSQFRSELPKLTEEQNPTNTPVPTSTPAPTSVATPTRTATTVTVAPITTDRCSSSVINGSVNVRTGAGSVYPIQTVFVEGTQLDLTGYYGNWYQIDLDGQDLWLYGDYVDTNCDVSYTSNMPPVPTLLPPTVPAPVCHPAYESVCLPIVDDLNCDDFSEQAFSINPSNDPYNLDADGDGIACEISEYNESSEAPAAPPAISHPAGASAICRDDTYSYSQNRRGTCSHHGGVKQWL